MRQNENVFLYPLLPRLTKLARGLHALEKTLLLARDEILLRLVQAVAQRSTTRQEIFERSPVQSRAIFVSFPSRVFGDRQLCGQETSDVQFKGISFDLVNLEVIHYTTPSVRCVCAGMKTKLPFNDSVLNFRWGR